MNNRENKMLNSVLSAYTKNYNITEVHNLMPVNMKSYVLTNIGKIILFLTYNSDT